MLFESYVRFHPVNCVAAYWEIAAHIVKDMFFLYSYLIVNLVFFRLGI